MLPKWRKLGFEGAVAVFGELLSWGSLMQTQRLAFPFTQNS